jgi:hypothetical protein
MNPYKVEINQVTFKSEEYPITLEVFDELNSLYQEAVYEYLHYAMEHDKLVCLKAYTEQWGLPDELDILLGNCSYIDKDSINPGEYQDPRELFKIFKEG